MKRLIFSMGAFLVVALALVSEISTVKSAEAACTCPSFTGRETEDLTGVGAGCGQAHTNLIQTVNAAAWADCGGSSLTCLGTLVVTESCPTGGTTETGYRNYNCKVCS